jgi:sulfur relay (sulfurtransferase) DsrF/TusC family protein
LSALSATRTIGLLVRSLPYRQRSARAQLDVALVAAALEQQVRLYFLGAAVLQLQPERAPDAAKLPPGYKGWASLPELGEVTAFAEPGWLDRLSKFQGAPILAVTPLTRQEMRTDWQACDRIVVL